MNSSSGPGCREDRRAIPLPVLLPLAILVVAVLSGCSREAMAPDGAGLSIVPADGAIGVRVDASVVLGFDRPVTRDTVERSFHLLSEGAMNDSICSADSATIGEMTEMMGSVDMMDHMIGAHSISGEFRWNGNGECTFTPVAPMTPGTRYMIHLAGEMTEMMGGTSMMGHGNSTGREMTFHFTTVDETSHDSHH